MSTNWIKAVMRGIAIFLAFLAQVIGGLALLGSLYFLVQYFSNSENPLRYEYISGTSILFIYATGVLLFGSVIISTFRSKLSPKIFGWLFWPGLLVGSLFLGVYVIAGVLALLNL